MTVGQFSTQSDQIVDLLHFGQLLKASDNHYFAQITHIYRQSYSSFCLGSPVWPDWAIF